MTRDEKMAIVNLAAEAAYSAFANRNNLWADLKIEKRGEWRVAALASLCAIPGLSDVLDGKAVIMPLMATKYMLAELSKNFNGDQFDYEALIAASPYARKP